MRMLFYALLFMFINIQINLGAASIALIPTFIGFYFLRKGTLELSDESDHFVHLSQNATWMMLYHLVVFFLDLLGLTHRLGLFTLLLALIGMIITYYAASKLLAGIRDMEGAHGIDLRSGTLYTIFYAVVVTGLLSLVGLIFPPLALLAILVNIVVSIIFLVQFHTTLGLYESHLTGTSS